MEYFDYDKYLSNNELIDKLIKQKIDKRKSIGKIFLFTFLVTGIIIAILGLAFVINSLISLGLSLLIIGCIFILISFLFNILFPKNVNRERLIKDLRKKGINL